MPGTFGTLSCYLWNEWMDGASPHLIKAMCGHLRGLRIVLISNDKSWYDLCSRHLLRALSAFTHFHPNSNDQPHCTAAETEAQRVKALTQGHTAGARRQGFDPTDFTFDSETYGFFGSSDFGNGTLTVGTDTETPGDIKEPRGVLFQGIGAFSVEGEMGRGDTQENRQSWFLGALSPLAGVYPSGCVPGSRPCGGVWSSQPAWRAGVPLGCSWHSGDDCPAQTEPPCSRCQAEWIQCVLIMNEWLIATALENYDVTSLTIPRTRVQMMLECIIGMLASVTKCIINQAP